MKRGRYNTVEIKPKVKLALVALLTPFKLLYRGSEEFSIDAQIARCMERTAKSIENIGDLNKGIEIGPEVILRLTSNEDRENFKTFSKNPSTPLNLNPNAFVLETFTESDETLDSFFQAWEKLDRNINCVVNAFRLFKSGDIEANLRLTITMRCSGKQLSLHRETAVPHYDFQKDYQLLITDIARVKTLTEKVDSIDFSKRGSLRIALDRFERSYYEPYLEDQLIDYMIAFEALFIGKKMREQGTVIPVAAAMLLGRTEKERQEIMDVMDLAYNIRNCLVHGSDYTSNLCKKRKELPMLTKEVEDILRKSLQKLL